MAWISLAKFSLFMASLVFLLAQFGARNKDKVFVHLWSAHAVLVALLMFAISLLWSQAPTDIALLAFAKHGKLIEILILISLIRTPQEARTALVFFLTGQALLLASSWAMAAGIRIPWATSDWETIPQFKYVVYSTYLDQSIIFASSAAIFWHLRLIWPKTRWVAAVIATLAISNTLLLLEGRSGYLVAMAMITLSIMWAMPSKVRVVVLMLAPVIILSLAMLTSSKVSQRLSAMIAESQTYAVQGTSESSSGFRLNAWKRSMEAMMQAPLLGHGVGSWTESVKRLEGVSSQKVFGTGNASNPHQEYLLWGVELGFGGALLLLAFFACIVRDSFGFVGPVKRATISVAAAAAIACLFNSTLYDALIGDYFCVALGLLMALGVRTPLAGTAAERDSESRAPPWQ